MKAHELLREPERWTQRAYARDKDGNDVRVCDDDAVAFCIEGAIFKCYGYIDERYAAMCKLDKKLGVPALRWNDAPERTHAEVLALLIEEDV